MFLFTFLEKKGNFGVFQEFFGDFDDCTDFILTSGQVALSNPPPGKIIK